MCEEIVITGVSPNTRFALIEPAFARCSVCGADGQIPSEWVGK
jgi:hypothetical protein